MPLFLGLDCGGTSTRSLVIDEREQRVFEGRGGPANVSTTEPETARRSLAEALKGCPSVDAAVGCFAGLLGEQRRVQALDWMRAFVQTPSMAACPDYLATLALAGEGDVVVTAGTGSVVCSWKDGQPVKTGGGGPLLGDEGSAFDVGRQALANAALKGWTPGATQAFLTAVKGLFGTDRPEEAVAALYDCPDPAPRLARLGSLVVKEAGEPYARLSLEEAMSRLANLVHRHACAYCQDSDCVSVLLAGGLWEAGPAAENCFTSKLQDLVEGAYPPERARRQYHVVRLDGEPVLGAARLAKRLFDGHRIP